VRSLLTSHPFQYILDFFLYLFNYRCRYEVGRLRRAQDCKSALSLVKKMSRFKNIDSKLVDLANKLNARLTKDRPNYPEALRTFEERRIDWIENHIMKAIIIQPNFESNGVNSNIWNFINLAIFDDGLSISNPKWMEILVDQKDFIFIDDNIDKLLLKSEQNLSNISIEDLV
jgi:hypothetical protein